MKISVIIPVYNVQEYIKQCLDSVVKQNYENLEVIIINDGSKDNSVNICKEYCGKYNYIKIVHKENEGLSQARNVGISKASGEYIIFLDSDDYWKEDFISDLVDKLKLNQKIDYIFFGVSKFYQDKQLMIEEKLNIDTKYLIDKTGAVWLEYILENNKDFGWYACRALIRRKLIIDNRLFFEKGKSYEDMLWTPQVLLSTKNIYFYDKNIYVYRLNRTGQITSTISKKNIKDSIYSSVFWHKKINEYKLENSFKEIFLEAVSIRYFYAIWFTGFLDKTNRSEIYKMINENKYILKYTCSKREKITSIVLKVIGVRSTVNLYYIMIRMKRFLRS